MKHKIKKVVLAYSGGLDTSVILHWIKKNYGCKVITFTADLGQEEDLKGIKEKALASGADKAYVVDLKEEFVKEYVFPVLKSGAMYEGKYLLGTSFARPIAAKKQVEIAEKEKADAVAHGCTGKGNDQVRFELTYKALNPKLKIIAPWREWDLKSREDEIEYAKAHGIPVTSTKEKIYSTDTNLWHRSIEGGILEDPWQSFPEDAYSYTTPPEKASDEPGFVEIEFRKGIPIAVDGKKLSPVNLILYLNKLGKKHGIGMVDIVEDRLVGIKSRGVYETPGGTILYEAHRQLESLVLEANTLHFKMEVANLYARLVYYGLWFSELKEALDAFIDKTQDKVTGVVRLKLYKGNIITLGRKSPYSIYRKDFATFGEDKIYNQKDAEGFINLFGLQLTIKGLNRLKEKTNLR
ncbi:MAG: argininosuccinate synthase [candidate division WOR-3 bacterium]